MRSVYWTWKLVNGHYFRNQSRNRRIRKKWENNFKIPVVLALQYVCPSNQLEGKWSLTGKTPHARKSSRSYQIWFITSENLKKSVLHPWKTDVRTQVTNHCLLLGPFLYIEVHRMKCIGTWIPSSASKVRNCCWVAQGDVLQEGIPPCQWLVLKSVFYSFLVQTNLFLIPETMEGV